MSTGALISRLDRVNQTGRDRWIARCPAHEDQTPSLSIRALEDGRTLLHCFAGCDVHDIVSVVGLQIDDLFPERPLISGAQRERRPFNAHDALRAIAFEATVVRLCAASMRDGMALTDEDEARLAVAFTRIVAAETLINAR